MAPMLRALLAIALLAAIPADASDIAGRVVAVHDGDTLTLLQGRQQIKVRVANIDAPELKQAFGQRSRQSLASLCFGKPATVETVETDRYKRTVGHVSCAGADAGSWQVRTGMAWVYRKYAAPQSVLYRLEQDARTARRGLWADEQPTPPWDWRREPGKKRAAMGRRPKAPPGIKLFSQAIQEVRNSVTIVNLLFYWPPPRQNLASTEMDDKKIAEYAHDLQVGLSRTSVPDFEQLPLVGMAGILALHIRGLGEIEYGSLKYVAEYHFDIPAMVLRHVLGVLAEVEYVKLVTEGPTIKKVIPSVPHFDSVYTGLGQYIGAQTLTEHEQLSVAILDELSSKPEKRDALLGRLGAGTKLFAKCERIVAQGGLVLSKRARGQDILLSPAYFTDNLAALADLAAAGGAKGVEKLLKLLKTAQGWPLSLIESRKEIAGTKLSDHEIAVLKQLVGDGVLKPPSIKRPRVKRDEFFVFTPRPGRVRLDASNRQIYERAMGLVAAVRKGQLLPEEFKIYSPVALLRALRDRKRLGANSEAANQYRNLVTANVGTLKQTHSGRYEFRLIDTEENCAAVEEALSLVMTGDMDRGAVNKEARILLTQDEKYVQSVIAAKNFRTINAAVLDEDAKHEVNQMLLDLK